MTSTPVEQDPDDRDDQDAEPPATTPAPGPGTEAGDDPPGAAAPSSEEPA